MQKPKGWARQEASSRKFSCMATVLHARPNNKLQPNASQANKRGGTGQGGVNRQAKKLQHANEEPVKSISQRGFLNEEKWTQTALNNPKLSAHLQ
jgi:hypothetical protein